MGFKRLPSAAFEIGKATSMSLWMLARKNFISHENRILDLEGSPPSIVTGMILPFAGASAPTGWMLCDGSAINRTTYSALFTALSTNYGVGDGSTTFNIPDFRGRCLVGYGAGSGLTSRAIAASGGEENHTVTTAELPVHNHTKTDPGHDHAFPTGRKYNSGAAAIDWIHDYLQSGTGDSGWQSSSSTTGMSIASTGGGGSHNNMQPSLVLNFIIKT